ncbi:hypothetical protein A8L34_22585 [Bacillus sp. FJAT-27264]|uniref:hypothetical protein n=1 Tax=Paenibacillus sp. (strain DSM 101736 / FJAT-27264) TaxID=1850362 RepID=UPI000807C426|nr:hypothetical protein [Bacillus sp. FJAT-27264]OBZ08939.1 hypothetical protein A8L34_22585 [Bacillus sp. FJAT-27264]
MKINWRSKLSSRKFWALIAAVATSVLGAFGATDAVSLKITGIITAVGACAVYMLAEAYADGNNSDSD